MFSAQVYQRGFLLLLAFYGTAGITTEANKYNGMNASGFSNPRMDQLLSQAETELELQKQKAIWREMQQIYATELPELPLYFREDPDIVPTWLKGYEATGKEDYVHLSGGEMAALSRFEKALPCPARRSSGIDNGCRLGGCGRRSQRE